MQTFLPYPDCYESLKCLDYRRLGKQRDRIPSPEISFQASCPCCDYPFLVDENKLTAYVKAKLLKIARGW